MTETASAPAAAFAATRAIEAGEWDAFLAPLMAAIRRRQGSPEYKAAVLARAEFRAGS